MCDIRSTHPVAAPYVERAGAFPVVNSACFQDGVILTSQQDSLTTDPAFYGRDQQPPILGVPSAHQRATAPAPNDHVWVDLGDGVRRPLDCVLASHAANNCALLLHTDRSLVLYGVFGSEA